ncbi:MAG TPA: PepSY-associated TM helix domain-containing protein [Caulobacter sp.]|nr:PepSY-associated TM helix domain-containing protein [Caulobacter sp.]
MTAPATEAPRLERAQADKAKAKKRALARAAFMREIVRWHWISAAICLIGMILFAVTGFTLNHARQIEAKPQTVSRKGEAPPPVIAAINAARPKAGPLPAEARHWLGKAMKVKVPATAAVEWSDGEAYVALPRPGGDAWVSVDTETGAVEYEATSRGWIAYLNDLHKGRNTGAVWSWFLDIFAAGTIVFCVTGLILLWLHSHARKTTWPYVGLGLLIPFLIALLFIH